MKVKMLVNLLILIFLLLTSLNLYSYETTISYPGKGEYIEQQKDLQAGKIVKLEHYKTVSNKKYLYRKRYYKPIYNYKLSHEDVFNIHKQTILRIIFDKADKIQYRITYIYKSLEDQSPYAFKIFNRNNELVRDYNSLRKFDLTKIYKQLPVEQQLKKQDNFKNQDRLKVAIIDSGIDIFHPLLASKMWNNPEDEIDGIDNDGNGLIDDWMGWQLKQNRGIPLEPLSLRDKIPDSHGTHVASIFSRDINKISIIPFVGDHVTSRSYKIISREISNKNIGFVNMSLAIYHWRSGAISRKAFFALRNMIEINRETLFVVAAGNGGELIRNSVNIEGYPSIFDFENILSIGSLNTDDFIEDKMYSYKRAIKHSNYSVKHVDILAPGLNVSAAAIGGGFVKHTGTSMATPFVLNIAIKIKLQFPMLSSKEIKEIIIKSAYIPDIDNPFLVKSGGMIFPRRALETAHTYIDSTLENIEEASLTVRKNKDYMLINEYDTVVYFNKLKRLWAK